MFNHKAFVGHSYNKYSKDEEGDGNAGIV